MHYIGVVFPFMGLPSFLFLDDFEGNINISVAIKSGSTVSHLFPAVGHAVFVWYILDD